MKSVFRFLLIVPIVLFALTACSAIPQGIVELPETAQTNIGLVAVAFVALILEWVIARVPWLKFLAAYSQEWGLLLGSIVSKYLSEFLPGGVWEQTSLAFLNALIVLAFVLLGRKFLATRNIQGFIK